jgi:hypothetical protein
MRPRAALADPLAPALRHALMFGFDENLPKDGCWEVLTFGWEDRCRAAWATHGLALSRELARMHPGREPWWLRFLRDGLAAENHDDARDARKRRRREAGA